MPANSRELILSGLDSTLKGETDCHLWVATEVSPGARMRIDFTDPGQPVPSEASDLWPLIEETYKPKHLGPIPVESVKLLLDTMVNAV